ncbi:MAG: AMP-binding protein [Acidobacteriota bacterium]
MNLAELVRQRTVAAESSPCLRFDRSGEEVWTYRELLERGRAAAGALTELGVQPGDRVVVQVEKSPEAVALYLGVLWAGAVFVPLNVAYTAAEVAFFVEDCAPRLVVVDPQRLPSLEEAEVSCEHVLTLSSAGGGSWLRASLEGRGSPEPAACSSGELAAIVYTSGTTGRSKGAMITHGNLTSNALALYELWGFVPGDVLLHALPIFHVHGLFVALHTAFLNASEIRFLPRFDLDAVCRSLPQCSVMMGVPTFYGRLLEHAPFDRELVRGMRLFVSGSAPLTEATFEAFERRTGHRILERYGMSEAGMITSNPLDGERVAGTVGYPLPGVDVRVCDASDEEVEDDDVGVLQVRGPNVFAGYWKLPEKTEEEHRPGGWFVSGDLVTRSADGRIAIVGRAKDLVISGGYNIYPKEIESVLDRVPGVLESAVVGVPHSDLGEGVVAVLVAEQEPVGTAVLQLALDAELARFKHPRRFEWVDALPRNAMAKVQKQALRERYWGAYD